MSIKSSLIISDLHVPFHHSGAYKLILKIIKDIKPHRLIINGDFVDMYNWSRFMKNPEFEASTLDAEITLPKEILKQLREYMGNREIVYMKGNHSMRIENMVINQAPKIYRFVKSFSEIFGISDLNIHLVNYSNDQIFKIDNSDVYCRHEPYKQGVNFARATLLECGHSLIVGHTHKKQSAQRISNFKQIECHSFGWLADYALKEVFAYEKYQTNSLGMGMCHVINNGAHFIEPLPIAVKDGKTFTVCGGKLYEV